MIYRNTILLAYCPQFYRLLYTWTQCYSHNLPGSIWLDESKGGIFLCSLPCSCTLVNLRCWLKTHFFWDSWFFQPPSTLFPLNAMSMFCLKSLIWSHCGAEQMDIDNDIFTPHPTHAANSQWYCMVTPIGAEHFVHNKSYTKPCTTQLWNRACYKQLETKQKTEALNQIGIGQLMATIVTNCNTWLNGSLP